MKSLFSVILTLLMVISLQAGEFNQPGDFQVWEYQAFTTDLSPCATFYLDSEFRWGNNASELYLSYLESGVRFSLCDWLMVAPGYRQLAVLRPADHKRIPIYNPLFDFSLTFLRKGWTVIDRNRTQYLIFEDRDNRWQYRNRITLFTPLHLGQIGLNPFISNEVFFVEREGFSQDRLRFGGKITFCEEMSGDLYYLFRMIKFPGWRSNHILGINLHVSY